MATKRRAKNPQPKPKDEPGWTLVPFTLGTKRWHLKHDAAGRWVLRLGATQRKSDTRVARRQAKAQRAMAAVRAREDERKAVAAQVTKQRRKAAEPSTQVLQPTAVWGSSGQRIAGKTDATDELSKRREARTSGTCGQPTKSGGACKNPIRNGRCAAGHSSGGNAS